MNLQKPLVVAISSRALFDLNDSHNLFEREGLDAYRAYQIEHEEEVLKKGVAFPVVEKLLALNDLLPHAARDVPPVEVVLLSRNSSDTGLRIFNAIEHYHLQISRAAFTSGASTSVYIEPFQVDLFLSAHAEDVRGALDAGVAAATILPGVTVPRMDEQLRIAFDGDAVIFGDEGERLMRDQGLTAFHQNEAEHALDPLSMGPFRSFLTKMQQLQAAFSDAPSPIRTALVTARSAPSHKRVILTLRQWGIPVDEALFLGGRDKGPFLQAFGADIFFDDSLSNLESARKHVASGHVPHGVGNNPEHACMGKT